MLSLSFPRGYGLLVFVLPTYRRTRRRLPRLACPPLDRDLLADAAQLLAAGHPTAAAMTARVEIERLLTRLAMDCPEFKSCWYGIEYTADLLRKRRKLRQRTHRRVLAAGATGNAAAHGRPVTLEAVNEMFGAIDALRAAVERFISPKGGAA